MRATAVREGGTGEPERTVLHCARFRLDLSTPVVMGVLNVTPDSFSDGGRYLELPRALERARQMVEEGAALVDVGGESTRPGAAAVTEAEELRRVIPVIERLAAELPVPVAVDTRNAAVMRAALAAGAAMVNDVAALSAEGALDAVSASDAAVCLMHMQGEPRTMQQAPRYGDVVGEVRAFLRERAGSCVAAGIGRERIVVDPGFGFGKTLAHNLDLLRGLPAIAADGIPVLVGLSRKSMVGQLTGRATADRLAGSLALAVLAALNGARIVRAHDVGPTVDALRVAAAAAAAPGEGGA
ncbi:MAG: dihydropteroate synthase [Steroidobacteraceae bacterium]|nr:dihydropteroate synthase [Steroidobacteraceae bacterium]